MVDITMCKGETGELDEKRVCPVRGDCYRYTASADPYWQSYFVNTPYKWQNDDCQNFMNNEIKP